MIDFIIANIMTYQREINVNDQITYISTYLFCQKRYEYSLSAAAHLREAQLKPTCLPYIAQTTLRARVANKR